MILSFFGDVVSFGSFVTSRVVDLFNFVVEMITFIPNLFNYIPEPFKSICLTFLPIIIAVFLWKLWKGGS